MDASWLGLIGVVVGAALVSVTTLVTEHFKRRNDRQRDDSLREVARREALRAVIIRMGAAVTALALDKRQGERLRVAFDAALSCELEFGLLIAAEDSSAGLAVSNAMKAAMRAETAEQTSWISVLIAEHLPRWYRGEISGEEMNDIFGSVTSRIPANPAAE